MHSKKKKILSGYRYRAKNEGRGSMTLIFLPWSPVILMHHLMPS